MRFALCPQLQLTQPTATPPPTQPPIRFVFPLFRCCEWQPTPNPRFSRHPDLERS